MSQRSPKKLRIADDTPLGHLIGAELLRPRTVTALTRTMWTVGQLRAWWRDHEAGSAAVLPWVGPAAMDDIRRAMRRIA
jgi:hypothetical protein